MNTVETLVIIVVLAWATIAGSVSIVFVDEHESKISQLNENVIQLQDQAGAIIACIRNVEGYDRNLLGQCIDDWFEMHATSDF